MRDLIIDTPSMQSLWQRFSSILLTFFFWIVWFFIWTPLVTAIAWYIGLDLIYFEMFEMDGYKAMIHDFTIFLGVVTLLGGSLAVWAAYNFFRFRGVDRRAALIPVSSQEIAEYFEIKETELKKNQQAKVISVSFNDTGKIIDITNQTF